jgi:hypothetical protein
MMKRLKSNVYAESIKKLFLDDDDDDDNNNNNNILKISFRVCHFVQCLRTEPN